MENLGQDPEYIEVAKKALDNWIEELIEVRKGNVTEHRKEKYWKRLRERGIIKDGEQ